MAFNDFPKIDRPSINSEQSAISLQQILNSYSGFIMRPDVPDKGCDFDVELTRDQSLVTNWRFPIQLKSIETIALVQDDQFISYSFKTSRLGYLMRRIPAYGLVVLYDVKSSLLYYDYANSIYTRLMQQRESEEWKENDQVNILIPAVNYLNSTSAAEIHQTMLTRFEQATLMQASQGAQYGLPAISLENKKGYDFNSQEDVIKALKSFGMSLLLKFDLQIVYTLVIKLTTGQILSDKELCMVALIVYAEVGRFADSMYYIDRIRKRFELTKDEVQSVRFVELKNQLSLGVVTVKEYIVQSKMLLPNLVGTDLMVLKINLIFFQLSLIQSLEPMPLHFGDDIHNLFLEIEDVVEDQLQQQYLKLWNAENLIIWIAHFRNEGLAYFDFRQAMNIPLPLKERLEMVQRTIRVHSMFYTLLDSIDKKAKEANNLLLQAHVINLLLRFELSFEIQQISHDSQLGDQPNTKLLRYLDFAAVYSVERVPVIRSKGGHSG